MESPSERLAALDDAAFEAFVRRFATAVWETWNVAVSPPSPDHGFDVRLSKPDANRLLHVERRSGTSAVGAPAVRDLAALGDRETLDGVTLASTTPITDEARTAATERGVGILGPASLRRLCDELDIQIPESEHETDPERQDALDTYTAYWPDSLAERTTELLAALDEFADFEHEVAVGDASTVVDFRLGRRTVLKARLGETSVLVYVESGENFESVLRLSAHRETQPSLETLLADLEPHVEDSLGRRF